MEIEYEKKGVEMIINYLKSKSVSCEYDFDGTWYYGGRNDVSTIITPIGNIKFIEDAYSYNDNEISMNYDGKCTHGMINIIQELDSLFR